jgi:hypothetical protein
MMNVMRNTPDSSVNFPHDAFPITEQIPSHVPSFQHLLVRPHQADEAGSSGNVHWSAKFIILWIKRISRLHPVKW